ncbi:CsbD family protein [Sciscionella marina]|uniref:CsbD family protein n=1 Tax=Sciscionella marina TaxID=508770 RepID=UPI00036552EF|nr:CsbD family protein [Sciscionella marina]
MSFGDKMDDLAGKAKEAAGKATGDDKLDAEGKGDQAKAEFKEAAKGVKDAVSDAAGKAKEAFKKD